MAFHQYLLRNIPKVIQKHNNNILIKNNRFLQAITTTKLHNFSTTSNNNEEEVIERESMAFDVLIIGGGPAGLSASIKLKQLCNKHNIDLSICVLEKGSEIGSHILSGNVFETRGLKELLEKEQYNEWINIMSNEPYNSTPTPVTKDKFLFLSESSSYEIPSVLLPSQLHNDGNYIISLSQLCRYLGNIAEELGVEIFPGFAADEVIIDTKGQVKGVITKDAGISKDETHKSTYEPGMNLLANQTLFAEGARGSCTQQIIDKLNLDTTSSPQTYALGLKEVWTINDPENNKHFKSGLVQHTLGWPLQSTIFDKNFGGSFLYYQEPNLLLCGFVIGLDYTNTYLNPYKEFQKWKTHPDIKDHFDVDNGASCISYGARVLNEGGYHSIPKLTFPGGMLIGCSAGFLNTIKIKGTHTAIKSGIEAAEVVFEQYEDNIYKTTIASLDGELPSEQEQEQPIIECKSYQTRMENNWVGQELYSIRNCHAAFSKWGLIPGLLYSGIMPYLNGKEPWTLEHTILDSQQTLPTSEQEHEQHEERSYPQPDGKLTFDLLTNLQRSNTYHEEDQPSHLKIREHLSHVPKDISMQIYSAPEQRFCPAGVYEYPDSNNKEPKELVINAQNCIHCKCCSIKMPHEYIKWTVPEGGGGPQYQVM